MDNEKELDGCGCGPDCGCGHDHEHASITLTLEDDTELICHVLGNFDVDDREYIALLPEDTDEVLIYRYHEDGESIDIENIEDDAEFERASEVFQSILDDEEMDEDDE